MSKYYIDKLDFLIAPLPELITFLSKKTFERKQIQQTLGKQTTTLLQIVAMMKRFVPKMLEEVRTILQQLTS